MKTQTTLRRHETGKHLRKARTKLNRRIAHFKATEGRAKHEHKMPGSMKFR